VDVVVREWGEVDGRPLLFWPGLNPFGSLQLNEAGPTWAERGFRVLAVAAPGMGESPPLPDPEGYRPTRLADLVVELADRLELDRFDYVGWSWGRPSASTSAPATRAA
jgi:pimeloyl-ACP methyl ester carboxylesterase